MAPGSVSIQSEFSNGKKDFQTCAIIDGISTISSDYDNTLQTTLERNTSVGGGVSGQSNSKLEFEDAPNMRSKIVSKINVKRVAKISQILPPRTRQTLKIAGIGCVAILFLVAIFFLARLSEQHNYREDAVIVQQELEKHFEVDFGPAGDSNRDAQSPDYGANGYVKILKDDSGKAKQYQDRITNKRIPLFPHIDVERVKERRNYWHPANETEIEVTLDRVRMYLDADRKKISNKELRLWESGAEPMRVLIVSTWRSGSTFLGQMLQAHPGVFQHYEPLSYIGMRQVRSGKDAFQAQQLLHRLLDCDYDSLEDYMNFTKRHTEDMIGHNQVVWKSCKEGPNRMACIDSGFLSEACKMFPIQLVKTVRLRLNLTQLLLNDEKLRVKVIFLVRDPRGIMNSRYSSVSWCSSSEDCSSPAALCQDMQGDLKVSNAFEKLYPHRFLKIKYEDLAGNTEEEARKILNFLGLEFTESIKEYLSENTTKDKDTPWSIQRKSSDRVALWKQKLPLQEIHNVQNECGAVLKSLKYELLGS